MAIKWLAFDPILFNIFEVGKRVIELFFEFVFEIRKALGVTIVLLIHDLFIVTWCVILYFYGDVI